MFWLSEAFLTCAPHTLHTSNCPLLVSILEPGVEDIISVCQQPILLFLGVGEITLPSPFAVRQSWPPVPGNKINVQVMCDTFTLRQWEGPVGPASFSQSLLGEQW